MCITIVSTRKLRRRIREYVNDKKFYYDISELNKSAFIKMIFFMIEIGCNGNNVRTLMKKRKLCYVGVG